MIRSFTIALCMLLASAVAAQEQKSLLMLADEAFARQEYAAAGALYGKLVNKKGSKAPVALMIRTAQCYQEIGRFEDAGYWYQRLLERPDCPAAAQLLYGEVLKNVEKYEEAKTYIARFNSADADSMRLKERMLAGCDSALLWKADQADLALENIKELSSTGADWVSGVVRQGLLLVSNGYRKMSMNAPAERDPAIDARVNRPYFKAYVFKQYAKGVANTYVEEVLPELLGKIPYHIGPVCFNATEDTLYATLNVWQRDISDTRKHGPVNGKRLMSIFWSVKEQDKWKPLEPLAALNAAGSSTGHAVLSRDGSVLYFVSDRPGGQGRTDIWYSEKQADGQWGAPANCGPVINTPFEEAFPTVNEAGMLYFSSKGHPGMGGYDIFRATGSRAEWAMLQNLRSPFNSGADDLGFIMKSNKYEGYFASSRPGGGGSDDIYHFMDTHFSEKLAATPQAKKDSNTVTAPPAVVSRRPMPGRKADPLGPTGSLTGTDSAVVHKLETLQFYYDFNSAILLTTSRELLDRVAVVLLQYPNWKLVVRSYTDSRGQDSYNLDLSAMRCYAVIDYLIKKGLAPRRLYYENLGERDPVNPCTDGVPCSEAQHRQNRRTTLKVIY